MDYDAFLSGKKVKTRPRGFEPRPVNDAMFPHQRHGAEFAIRNGAASLFFDTGLGKSLCELEWAQQVYEHTNAPVLIITPLAVAAQMVREADKFGYDARVIRCHEDVLPGINIINYQRIDKLDVSVFAGVALDEASILKNETGKTRTALIRAFQDTPYRLTATATPGPNDHTEIGNQCEFLGVLAHCDMLPRWFINDTSDTGEWRLKGHAVEPFWDWVSTWARCCSTPSDLGYSDEGFILPEINIIQHHIDFYTEPQQGELLHKPDVSATGIHREKRLSMDVRASHIADIVNSDDEFCVVWVETDEQEKAMMRVLNGAVALSGKHSIEKKEEILLRFSDGDIKRLVTKSSIAGFGMNWQHCNKTAFVGADYSYEKFYQAVRRFWRFGQKREVNAHIAMTDAEHQIWLSLKSKADNHEEMKQAMRDAMHRNALSSNKQRDIYSPKQIARMPSWM